MHNGMVEIHPGIRLHPGPGHSPGLQFVSVETTRGTVVLASDVSHYYENAESSRPYTIAVDVPAMLESMERLRQVASTPDHIVPGHDPAVMQRYPAAGPGLEGIAVRLDLPPA